MTTFNKLPYSNQFERGHSFNWAGRWTPGTYYMNDEYVTDFIVYKNTILACRKNHKATSVLEPILVMSNGKISDVDSPYWEFIVSFLDQNPAGIQNVEYNENTGNITIMYTDGRSDQFELNIKVSDTSIYVGPIEPDNENKIWVDTANSSYNYDNETVLSIRKAVATLQQKVNLLYNIRTYGAVAGSLNDSTREEMMAAAESVIPSVIEEDYEDSEAFDDTTIEIKPDYKENIEPTVNSISIKMGYWNQLVACLQDFVQGEIIWCTDRGRLYIYIDGNLIPASGGSGSDDSDNMDTTTVNTLIDEALQHVDSIGFVPIGSTEPKYTVKVNEYGQLICYDNTKDTRNTLPSSNYFFETTVAKTGLVINEIYLGGNGDEHSYQPCSHNFIELANVAKDGSGNDIDVNLNGFYLYYRATNGEWFHLPLWGTVKGGGTFLIRGAQCSVMDVNTTKIKVKNFDMEWYITENNERKLISFDEINGTTSSTGVVFYIGWGDENGKIYDTTGTLTDMPSSLIINGEDGPSDVAKGYVDLVSLQTTIDGLKEKTQYSLPNGVSSKDVIFRRWYMLDPVTQSNPADGLSKHNNKKYMSCTFLNGANFDNLMDVSELTPKASFEGKTIANARTLFAEDYPSTLTCTFGIQATYKDSSNPATRCFCWNSVGYYDEGIRYKLHSGSTWTYVESFKKEVDQTASFTYQNYYNRMRWETAYGQAVTTHKVIIKGLSAGVYDYEVYRVNDESYKSETRTFTVRSDSSLLSGFTFAQTTDQQGANWEEYELWNLSAKKMKAELEEANPKYSDFDFTINTGDICYNGSRSNEWIDYFNGYAPLSDKEEMLTIGNNDLAPISMRDIGNGKESPWKINVNVMDYFYCIEIDENNPQVFTGESATSAEIVEYRIPSLYSFNYGDYHFLSLLSEIRTISNKEETTDEEVTSSSSFVSKTMTQSTVNAIFGIKDVLRGDGNKHASAIFDVEERWIIRDLLKWKGMAPINLPTGNFDLNTYRFDPIIKDACGKCIVFTHEMPFNIVSDNAYSNYEANADVPRETAKAYLNRYHDYEFQRSFKVWGIKLVMGGHKHTAAMTLPVYDAPMGYVPGTSSYSSLFTLADGETSFSNVASFQPIVQVNYSTWLAGTLGNIIPGTNVATIFNNSSYNITVNSTVVAPHQSYTYDNVDHPRARVEVVDTITAPSYIMCQATGFKNKSNSDLACSITNGTIPWENFFVPKDQVANQCYPFFTIYEVGADGNISVKMYKISGFYDANTADLAAGSKAGYWDLVKIYRSNLTLEENRNRLIANSSLERFNTTDTIISTT